MSKDITEYILQKAGFHKNPKTFEYQIETISNFSTGSFGKQRNIYIHPILHGCYEVRIYHDYKGLLALVDIKTICQFNKLMNLMDIDFKL